MILQVHGNLHVRRGCPQGSAFGPLLWNIFQNDLTFVIDSNIHMYADDHQLYEIGNNLNEVKFKLNENAQTASNWYSTNFLKGNFDKYQTMTLGTHENLELHIQDHAIRSTNSLRLLGITIDAQLKFDEHISITSVLLVVEK